MSVHATAGLESRPRGEPLWISGLKAALLVAAAILYISPLASGYGVSAAVIGILTAWALAWMASQRGLRLAPGLLFGLLVGFVGVVLSELLLESRGGPTGAFGVVASIHLSDALLFGCGTFGGVFVVRQLALRWRLCAVLEAVAVVGAAVYTFAAHRGLALHQPREFSDWALEHGLDPVTLLIALGILVVVLATAMLLRRANLGKLLLTWSVLLLTGGVAYLLLDDVRIEPTARSGGLGLTKQEQEDQDGARNNESGGGKGKGGGSAGGRSQERPRKVALVVFRDEYEDDSGILYFRQQVLSAFDGQRLAADSSGQWDRDVITGFPMGEPIEARSEQNLDEHARLPTTMHLMVDHPQPVALSHATSIEAVANPDPRRFVASYNVDSYRLTLDETRLLGRSSIPDEWSEEKRQHYLAVPDDPRYQALADILSRDADPRFFNDQLMTALVIKRYLEKEGFYTRREKHRDDTDPTASFLFGSLRGYCVHFAHAAALLMRSQGIASRVAVGYAVQTHRRPGGSSMLIMSTDAHAWPEIHVAGVGWVTFDIYPERSDEPPRPPVDRRLESVLGEIARHDPSGGKSADPDAAGLDLPLEELAWVLLGLLVLGLLAGYGAGFYRRLAPRFADGGAAARMTYRATLDRLTAVGARRAYGETRERHAQRIASLAPSFSQLTTAHLALALGSPTSTNHDAFRRLAGRVRAEIRDNAPLRARLLGALNPIAWWWTR